MAKRPPHTPRQPDADTANPHRAEPAPPPQEGLRPEADPALIRPESDEPLGPAAGLFSTAAAEAAHGTPVPTPHADAQTAYLGVEEEGVESSQIFGLMLATVASIICGGLFIYYLFYLPKLDDTEAEAGDVPEGRYVEQRELRAEAENLLSQYATNPEAAGRYRIPVTAAMQEVARTYAGRAGAADSLAAGPVSRTDFNLAWISLHPAPAVAPAAGTVRMAEQPPAAVEASVAPPAVEEGAAPAPSIPSEQ